MPYILSNDLTLGTTNFHIRLDSKRHQVRYVEQFNRIRFELIFMTLKQYHLYIYIQKLTK